MIRGLAGKYSVALMAVVALLSGCAYGGDSGNPVTRSFSWFSYIGGDDLRATCKPGSAERYRLVYNGIYDDQIRGYDLIVHDQGDATLSVWVRGDGDVAQVTLDDLLKPWRGKNATLTLDAGQLSKLRQALQDSDAFGPAPRGLRLPSDDFYWIVSGCRGAHYSFNAFLHPSDKFSQATFPAVLLALDPTGVPYNRPRPPGERPYGSRSFPPYGKDFQDGRASSRFVLTVGENSLEGTAPLF